MSQQLTHTHQHPVYDHYAVFHDGPVDLADRLAGPVAAGLERGEEVLVCLDGASWKALSDAVGPASGRVTYVPADARYARPGAALTTVHRFAERALNAGAPAAWSIGAIPFDGSSDDDRWVRYEAAVDTILASRPLRLVCAYDASLPTALLESAQRTHAAFDGPTGRAESASYGPEGLVGSAPVRVPSRRPDVELPCAQLGDIRRTVGAIARVDGERTDDLLLVVSELANNALRHGASPAVLRLWADADQVVVECEDHGSGITDPYPDLRPRQVTDDRDGGFGLWVVGQLVDRFEVRHESGRTLVRVALRVY